MNSAKSGHSQPVLIRSVLIAAAVATVTTAFVAGCAEPRARRGRPPVINYVSLDSSGKVRVYNPDTQSSTNLVHPGEKITWLSTNDWGDFCVVFSRNDNPDGMLKWRFRHSSQQSVSIVAPPVAAGKQKVFKYTIVGFIDLPAPAGTPGGPTSTVAVTAEDPFIIIRN